MDIKIFKLFSGEEVIATLEDAKEEGFTVSKPMLIQIVPKGGGEMGLMLIPWIVGNQKCNVTIGRHVMSVTHPIEPAKEFEDQYLQQTSGIVLAKG